MNDKPYGPIFARTRTSSRSEGPTAHDCVKILAIRSGGARILSELGARHVRCGDVVLFGAGTPCGLAPEGQVITTALYLDRDYVVDQVFWQYADEFSDRLDAQEFVESRFSERAFIIALDRHDAGRLALWLDELVDLSVEGLSPERFYRAQSLVFSILDVVTPGLAAPGRHVREGRNAHALATLPRRRQFVPLRAEAREVARLMHESPGRRWTLRELAAEAHLSPSQFGRVFVEAFGASPFTYLTMIRTKKMAQLLRTTDSPVRVIASEVGWSDSGFAAKQFRRSIGLSPSRYRSMKRRHGPGRAAG